MKTELNFTSDLNSTSNTTSPFLPRVVEDQPKVDFRLDDRGRGFNLLFVTAEMLDQSPFTPLWLMQCRDRETLHALARWIAVRRDRWADWATIARTIGPDDFDAYIRQLLAEAPVMHVAATVLQTNEDTNEVIFSQHLASGTHRESEEVVRHRFAAPGGLAGFMRWFCADRSSERAGQLVQAAFSKGTEAFGDLLEELARPIVCHASHIAEGHAAA